MMDMIEIGKDFFGLKQKHRECLQLDEKKRKGFAMGAVNQIMECLTEKYNSYLKEQKVFKKRSCFGFKENFVSTGHLRRVLTKIDLNS